VFEKQEVLTLLSGFSGFSASFSGLLLPFFFGTVWAQQSFGRRSFLEALRCEAAAVFAKCYVFSVVREE